MGTYITVLCPTVSTSSGERPTPTGR